MFFLKKDNEYFFLVGIDLFTKIDGEKYSEENLFSEDVYKYIVDYCKKNKKEIKFSQTFVKEKEATMLLGTNDLKGDHSLALNAFIFEVYARIKDGIPVTKDFKFETKEVNKTQIEIYTIDNLKTKFNETN